jgi:hypothetical protein
VRGDAPLRVFQWRAVTQPNEGEKLIQLSIAVDSDGSPRQLGQRRLVRGDDGSEYNAHRNILTGPLLLCLTAETLGRSV